MNGLVEKQGMAHACNDVHTYVHTYTHTPLGDYSCPDSTPPPPLTRAVQVYMHSLTFGGLELPATLPTPAHRMNVHTVTGAPIVILACPTIKMDEQLVIFDVCHSCHGNQRLIQPVLGLKAHANLEAARYLCLQGKIKNKGVQ